MYISLLKTLELPNIMIVVNIPMIIWYLKEKQMTIATDDGYVFITIRAKIP